jgi:hypothetical protein
MTRAQWIAVAESDEHRDRVTTELALESLITTPFTESETLPLFFSLDAVDQLEALQAAGLRVYRKPRPQRPVYESSMRPAAGSEVPQGNTPDFSAMQRYLGSSPEGFDIQALWEVPGGTGEGVSVVDIEGSWRLTHEALAPRYVTEIGPPHDRSADFSHGTAVLGILSAARSGEALAVLRQTHALVLRATSSLVARFAQRVRPSSMQLTRCNPVTSSLSRFTTQGPGARSRGRVIQTRPGTSQPNTIPTIFKRSATRRGGA